MFFEVKVVSIPLNQVDTFATIPGFPPIVVCVDIWEKLYGPTSKIIYTVITSCIQFLFPVILVITLYLSIYIKLRNRPQVIKSNIIQDMF